MKNLMLLVVLFGLGFSAEAAKVKKTDQRAPANFDEPSGQGCYASGAHEEDGTFCVEFGAGPDGAKCRRIIPLNAEVAATLRSSSAATKTVCIWGSAIAPAAKSADSGLYFIYRVELR